MAPKQKATEGNSDEDISRCCEVVGTLRPINYGFKHNMTIRQITQQAFVTEIREISAHLKVLLSPLDNTKEGREELKIRGVVSTEERVLLKSLLEKLCEQQYVVGGDDDKRVLCDLLVWHNILRPSGNSNLTGFYEFHSFTSEVALRALLGKPFEEHHLTIPSDTRIESRGRGSKKTIPFLIEASRVLFDHIQQKVRRRLLKKH